MASPCRPHKRPTLRKALGLDAASSAHKLCAFAVGDYCLPGRGTGAEGHVGFPLAPSVRAPQLPPERRRLGRLTWTCGANWPSGGWVREPLGTAGRVCAPAGPDLVSAPKCSPIPGGPPHVAETKSGHICSKDFPTLFVFSFDCIFDSQKFSHYSQVH